jgi:hypothetical protein
MRTPLPNLRTSQLELRGQLSGLEREWVVSRLLAKRGVEQASCADDHPCRFVVEYDADQITNLELVNLLYVCGLPAHVVPPWQRQRLNDA